MIIYYSFIDNEEKEKENNRINNIISDSIHCTFIRDNMMNLRTKSDSLERIFGYKQQTNFSDLNLTIKNN